MSDLPESVLVINLIGFPPGSARGVKQTFKKIAEAAAFRRTVNYGLKNTAPARAQKYSTQIQCDDLNVPCLDGIDIGVEIVMECVAELGFPDGGTPSRPVVTGSLRAAGSFWYYRPVLTLLVTDFQWDTDETEATVGWRLMGEEV